MDYTTQDLNELKAIKNQNFAVKIALGAATVGSSTVAFNPNQEAQAIAVADVDTGINSIVTSADATADVALPIGLAVVGLGVLAMILRRFIMV